MLYPDKHVCESLVTALAFLRGAGIFRRSSFLTSCIFSRHQAGFGTESTSKKWHQGVLQVGQEHEARHHEAALFRRTYQSGSKAVYSNPDMMSYSDVST